MEPVVWAPDIPVQFFATLGGMEGSCSVENCTRPVRSVGYCQPHYTRLRRYGDPEAGGYFRLPRPPVCLLEGCEAPASTRGWCGRHYQRWQTYGDPEAPLRRSRNGEGKNRLNADGYMRRRLRGKYVMEHRAVMEEMLGRPMTREETVHHRNGIRTDNRPENLELWVGTRSGQRVEDLVAFVVEHYPELVRAALIG